MQYCDEEVDFEKILADERPRLVRLCAWFSGSREAAEDLAQEALMAAWRNRDQLVSPEKLKPWTTAIARNVCLNWSRRNHREQARLAYSVDSDESLEDQLQDDMTLELELDRHDLARLLDSALALLPHDTAQMLVEHYIKESSHAEIAEKLKLHPGTVAVRLQRGKLTLQRLLRKNLQAEAAAFGLINTEQDQWEETNIWCLSCGRTRLVGRFQKNEFFALRCPTCDPNPESIMAGLDLTKAYHSNLLGNVKSYKPAYTRLVTAFAPLYHQALKGNPVPCLACGQPVEVRIDRERKSHKHDGEVSQIILHCPSCGWASNKTLSGLVMAMPEAQRFWREHPRLKILPAQELESGGSAAILTRLQSLSGTAELAVVSRRETFETIAVHTNVKL